jgi:hypothetical protein
MNKNKCTHVCLDLPGEASLLGFRRVLTIAGTDAAFPESLELYCTRWLVGMAADWLLWRTLRTDKHFEFEKCCTSGNGKRSFEGSKGRDLWSSKGLLMTMATTEQHI